MKLLNKTKISDAEIVDFVREAGFARPTLLQKKAIPLIARGEDIAIEAGEKTGKTAAFILPMVKRFNKNSKGIKAVVLTQLSDKVRKIRNEFRRLVGNKYRLTFISLSEEEEIRKEVRRLSRNYDVVIGTPTRIIDHIRRGNIILNHLQMAVIISPASNEKNGFDEDIDFIFTKIPQETQIVLFSSNLREEGKLLTFLKHPYILPMSKWKNNRKQIEHSFIEVEEKEKRDILNKLLIVKDIQNAVVFCQTSQYAEKVNKFLKQLKYRSALIIPYTREEDTKKRVRDFNRGVIDILVTTDFAANKINVRPYYIINYDIPLSSENYIQRVELEKGEYKNLRQVITFVTKDNYFELLNIQESTKMNIKKEETPKTEDVLKMSIKRILQRIKEEENPDTLNYYKKLIKKNVPIFLRSYFSAFLFKEYSSQNTPQTTELTKLFISVGKNRKVYPKDLKSLFTKNTKIKASEVTNIKILDNYSFVDIPSKFAEQAIAKLNGYEFKGRRITVNYARKKEGKKDK